MKLLISMIAIIVIANQCGEKNNPTTAQSETQGNQNEMTITYEAQSRGFYEKIWANNANVSFSSNRALQGVGTVDISKEEWQEMMVLIKKIDLASMSKLKAPSEKRFSDGAAIGQLIIKTDKDEFLSAEFDHGNPPNEIKQIVNILLSLKEKD